jgi:hypothetical protein
MVDPPYVTGGALWGARASDSRYRVIAFDRILYSSLRRGRDLDQPE